jgi:catechol 2,3-dioxygenase-like lactoylglutathione lyase family enzyme
MLAHVVLPCADLQKSSSFYEAVLAPLGISKVVDSPEDVGFGAPGRPDFWLERLLDGQQMRELHVAFRASSRSTTRLSCAARTAKTSRPSATSRLEALTGGHRGVSRVAANPTTQHDVHCSVP